MPTARERMLELSALSSPAPARSHFLSIQQNQGPSVQATRINGYAINDEDAIHDNVASEIVLIAEKPDPIGNDLLVIEDSDASAFDKKKAKISELPTDAGYF